MIDEAHSLGFFGENGAGVCEHFGLQDEVELQMGTFSKSLATIGGFIASNKDVINYLRHHSRTFIFSASITPAAAGAVLAALDVMKEETWRPKQLWANTHRMLDAFRSRGFEIGHTTTPIIPLYVRDNIKTFQLTQRLLEDGIFVNPVVSPAVPSEDTLIRISLMATHTFDQIDQAVEIITKHATEMGILK
jgi:8-amino-7-oxononanoate synthase